MRTSKGRRSLLQMMVEFDPVSVPGDDGCSDEPEPDADDGCYGEPEPDAQEDLNEVLEDIGTTRYEDDPLPYGDPIDIINERWRTYFYPDDDGGSRYIKLIDPVTLWVRDSGAHMVQLTGGEMVYVSAGWIAISWMPYDPDHPGVA